MNAPAAGFGLLFGQYFANGLYQGDPTTDMYTTLERSIQQTLVAGVLAAGLSYPVYNNQVDTKQFKDSHAALSIMKVSDVPNYANGGGTGAHIFTPVLVNGVVDSFIKQDWPDSYDLLYQIVVQADHLDHVRALETVIRTVMRPHQTLKLWNCTANEFSTDWVNFHYAGYINRDVPSDSLYWRVLNLRFETFNFSPSVAIPAIKQANLDIETTG